MLAQPARERRLRANGLMHHVLEWGPEDAEAVVLCHGFLDLAFGFASLAPLLQGRRVIALDFRGHGESDRVPAGAYYYFPDYVLDLHALLPQLSDDFHLVGHSMGGTVCAMYASTHRVRTLSLLEGIGVAQEDASRAHARLASWLAQASAPPQPAELRDLDDAFKRLKQRHPQVADDFLRALAERSTSPHGAGLTWRFDPLHRTQSPLAFDAERFRLLLAKIEAPTLLLSGEHGYRPPDFDRRMAALRNHAHHVIAGAGHMLHWSHPVDVAAQLNRHFA
jgi:pimeloyl-ACP methyl ester carboxylesterase